MATHIIGKRMPAQLGINCTVPTAVQTQINTANTFYVVSRSFGGAMQGHTANKSKTGNGTLYAVFNSAQKAMAFIKANKMQFYAVMVAANTSIGNH